MAAMLNFNLATNSVPTINNKTNIIAGPGEKNYWDHSPGALAPMILEEGPFPVQGNIGSLIKNEATNYTNCVDGPDIGSGPNCTGSFKPDMYTTQDTCGSNCLTKYPESYGLQDFGFPSDSSKVTNAHQVHLYSNIRAGMAGQTSETGCYEWIPYLSSGPGGSCELTQSKDYSQVGNWNFLPMYNSLQTVRYTPFNQPGVPMTQGPTDTN
jgi:hypothetical protein